MFQQVLSELGNAITPYLVPILLALLAFWKRIALAKATAEISHNYNQCLEELKFTHTKKVNIHRIQFEVEIKAYQELWEQICNWRHEFRNYSLIDISLDGDSKIAFDHARDEYFSAEGKFQVIFDKMVRVKPFVYGEVHKELEKILRIYESEISSYFHARINSNSVDSNWYQDRTRILRKLDSLVYDVLSEKIKERIGIIEVI